MNLVVIYGLIPPCDNMREDMETTSIEKMRVFKLEDSYALWHTT